MKISYIVDVDGTLSEASHRLHFIQQEPQDWDSFFAACEKDTPIWSVIDVIKALSQLEEYEFIYLTGRPERIREITYKWLRSCGLPNGPLVMRGDTDRRPDTEYKKEHVESLLASGHKINACFEDRPAMCRVFRELGLFVFQMNDQEF